MIAKYVPLLQQTTLFAGVGEEQLPLMLNCLGAYSKTYGKDEYVLHLGTKISAISIVLSGSVFLIRDDYAGNREILGEYSSWPTICRIIRLSKTGIFKL